jgi:DNA-binding SARP family transcriptional activator
MEFRILGPLEVVHAGRSVVLGGARERALLALLLLSANRVVSSERLAEDLWGGSPPEGAAQALRAAVFRLRKALRAAGADEVVLTRPPGYMVRVDPEALDAVRFEALAARARAQMEAGDHAGAAATLRQALALWRGPALADLPDAPMGRAEAARLEEARLAATEARLDADLACGCHKELVGELEALTRAHPLRERLWAQRLVALYRTGRQAEALRAYQELRHLLGEELGIEPSQALRRLEGAILRQEPGLDWQPLAPAAIPTEPAPSAPGGLVTILFTDLVGSTELVFRAGDDEAQRVLGAHRALLTEAVAAHGGHEVKWLGDGLMVAFSSAADAVRCAIAMQQTSRRPVKGNRLSVRVGLSAGEPLREPSDYMGAPVIVARRLCDRAEGGQILCTPVVRDLLAGRAGFSFADVGLVDLKGVPDPVLAFEVCYEAEPVHALLTRMPFVGRKAELGRLEHHLAEAAVGRGGVAMVVGEPGIGKTRLAEELAEHAADRRWLVAWGHCFEGEWAPPYSPFTQAIDALVGSAPPERLRADLGPGAGALAQLVPRVRQVLPDVPEPVRVQPDEERFRLLDSAAQFILATSRRAPVLLCLDDLHWADGGTAAMLRHLARFAPQHRILVLGTYRDVDLARSHPLVETLGALRREVEYERLKLRGLHPGAVGELLTALADQDVPEAVAESIAEDTDGNPFFIKEVARHLIEEEKVYRGADGRWTSDLSVRQLGIPEGIREAIGRRLSRLSEPANRLLGVACGFEADFHFDVVAEVAGLDEAEALDALDEALAAQLVQPVGGGGAHTFTHALICHTIYKDLSSPRRARLHRRLAEALWSRHGADLSPARAGEIASQYYRSAGLPGAEKGVDPALAAAAHAEATGANEEAAGFLHVALDLLPTDSPRRPRLLGRLGKALSWALRFDEAIEVVTEAAEALAVSEGEEAATAYLADAVYACEMAGNSPAGWELARHGLTHAGDCRDAAWARLYSFNLQRLEAEDEEAPGLAIDTPERWEAAAILRDAESDPMAPGPMVCVHASRAEALKNPNLAVMLWQAGQLRRALAAQEAEAAASLSRGQFYRAARCFSYAAASAAGLGLWDDALRALAESFSLADRVGRPVATALYAQEALAVLADGDLEPVLTTCEAIADGDPPALRWALCHIIAIAARAAAHLGRIEAALAHLERLLPWLERAPAWTMGFAVTTGHAAEVLWLLDRSDHIETVERSVRDKTLAPDFRAAGTDDARLSLARLCALADRHDEAVSWFAEARRVLDEEGARPLRAITEYDEALMEARRGDAARARPLLEAAQRQFEAIGMTGWLRRADDLARDLQ